MGWGVNLEIRTGIADGEGGGIEIRFEGGLGEQGFLPITPYRAKLAARLNWGNKNTKIQSIVLYGLNTNED